MRGVLVFPSCQIFSVPRFCQQITGAITTSRLEGLTSGLRITHTAIPLYARHSRCPRRIGGIGGDRTHDLLITNELLCQLSYDTGSPPCLRPGGRADVRQRGLRPRDRIPARTARGTPGALQRIDRCSLSYGRAYIIGGALKPSGKGSPLRQF